MSRKRVLLKHLSRPRMLSLRKGLSTRGSLKEKKRMHTVGESSASGKKLCEFKGSILRKGKNSGEKKALGAREASKLVLAEQRWSRNGAWESAVLLKKEIETHSAADKRLMSGAFCSLEKRHPAGGFTSKKKKGKSGKKPLKEAVNLPQTKSSMTQGKA